MTGEVTRETVFVTTVSIRASVVHSSDLYDAGTLLSRGVTDRRRPFSGVAGRAVADVASPRHTGRSGTGTTATLSGSGRRALRTVRGRGDGRARRVEVSPSRRSGPAFGSTAADSWLVSVAAVRTDCAVGCTFPLEPRSTGLADEKFSHTLLYRPRGSESSVDGTRPHRIGVYASAGLSGTVVPVFDTEYVAVTGCRLDRTVRAVDWKEGW